MMENRQIKQFLLENQSFTTKDFVSMVRESDAAYSDRKAYRVLQDLQSNGKIMKVGRGHYSKMSVKDTYHFDPSALIREITASINQEYPLVTFQTWEIYQWNEFVNHPLAPNAFFGEVENQLETTIFEMLFDSF